MNLGNVAAVAAAVLICTIVDPFTAPAAETTQAEVGTSSRPDATLYASYYSFNGFRNLSFSVCGYLPQSEGCYGEGSFGPFGHIGAMVEGFPVYFGNSVQRRVFIVDTASGASGKDVKLYVYRRTDTITDAAFDEVTTKFEKSIDLPLLGGSTALCSMAANEDYVFIGTNLGPSAAIVKKGAWTVTETGGFSPPINVSSITANYYGYVTVAFSNGSGSDATGHIVFGPDGESEGGGGGATFMLGSAAGVSTTTEQLPTFDRAPTLRPIVLRPHQNPTATASP